ncbi:abc transporter family protein [Pelomyxa schiedti]|nr:abc transporter family protein [Pelomyxa schiedti]
MLFLMCVFALFCLPAISKYIDDRLLYSREHSSKLYSTGAYFFSEFFVELPILVVIVIIYGCISYWMVNLNPDPGRFFFFLWIILSVILVGFSVSQAIAAAVSSVNMAIAIYMLVLVYSLLLGGFIVSANDLPKATQWLLRTSYFFYGFEALVINEFEGKSYGQDQP